MAAHQDPLAAVLLSRLFLISIPRTRCTVAGDTLCILYGGGGGARSKSKYN